MLLQHERWILEALRRSGNSELAERIKQQLLQIPRIGRLRERHIGWFLVEMLAGRETAHKIDEVIKRMLRTKYTEGVDPVPFGYIFCQDMREKLKPVLEVYELAARIGLEELNEALTRLQTAPKERQISKERTVRKLLELAKRFPKWIKLGGSMLFQAFSYPSRPSPDVDLYTHKEIYDPEMSDPWRTEREIGTLLLMAELDLKGLSPDLAAGRIGSIPYKTLFKGYTIAPTQKSVEAAFMLVRFLEKLLEAEKTDTGKKWAGLAWQEFLEGITRMKTKHKLSDLDLKFFKRVCGLIERNFSDPEIRRKIRELQEVVGGAGGI